MSLGDDLARLVKQEAPKELTTIRQGKVIGSNGTVDVVGAPVKFLYPYSPQIGDTVWVVQFGPDWLGLGPAYAGNVTPPEISADKHYQHTQSSPSSIWTVTHNLGKFPAVSVVDSSNREVVGEVEHLSSNQTRLTFVGSFSGKAYFN